MVKKKKLIEFKTRYVSSLRVVKSSTKGYWQMTMQNNIGGQIVFEEGGGGEKNRKSRYVNISEDACYINNSSIGFQEEKRNTHYKNKFQ